MYYVEVKNSGATAFNVKSRDYEFVIDTKGAGVTPPDTLLASLGACVGVYLRKFAEGYKIPLNDFTVTAQGELSKEAPVSFKKIEVKIDLKGLELDEQKKARMMEFIKNCPIHNTLEHKPEIGIFLA